MRAILCILAAGCGLGAARCFLHLPSQWLCDYGETPTTAHLPKNRKMPFWGYGLFALGCGGALWGVVPLLEGSLWQKITAGVLCAALFAVLLLAAWCDGIYTILPDELLVVGAVLAVLLALTGSPLWHTAWYSPFVAAACGLVGFWAFQALAARLYKTEAMGFGDVKLAGVLGLLCGGAGLGAALVAAVLVAALTFAVLLSLKKLQMHDAFPFGPFLVAGGLLATGAYSAWQNLLAWYLGMF